MDEILKIIADNSELSKVLRETLEKEFSLDDDVNDIDKITSFSNEFLGQSVRARLEGLTAINRAFLEINKHKTIPEKPFIKNPAR